MKSSGHLFSSDNSFYLKFLSCTILTLTIFDVTVRHSDAAYSNDALHINGDGVNINGDGVNINGTASDQAPVINSNETVNYTAAVSTFTILLLF